MPRCNISRFAHLYKRWNFNQYRDCAWPTSYKGAKPPIYICMHITFLSVPSFLLLLLLPFFREWTVYISFIAAGNMTSPLSIPKTKYFIPTKLFLQTRLVKTSCLLYKMTPKIPAFNCDSTMNEWMNETFIFLSNINTFIMRTQLEIIFDDDINEWLWTFNQPTTGSAYHS